LAGLHTHCNIPTENYLIKINKSELKFKHRDFIIRKRGKNLKHRSMHHNSIKAKVIILTKFQNLTK